MGMELRVFLVVMYTEKKVVGELKSVSWGGVRTKGKGRECNLTKKVFLHSDLLKLRLRKKHNITWFFMTQLCLMIVKLVL